MTFVIPYPSIDPILFQLGPLIIRWYALAYIGGLLLGWWYMRALAAQSPVAAERDEVDDFLVWATLGVVFGGRLGYVLFFTPGLYLAKPAHIFACWRGAGVGDAPHAFEELFAREHPVRMPEEERQQLESEVGHGDQLTVTVDRSRNGVDRHVGEDQDRGFRRICAVTPGPRESPQHCIDAGEQFGYPERFRDVVVGTEAQCRDLVDLVLAGGEHDDGGGVAAPAELFEYLEAILFGERDVEEDQVGTVLFHGCEAGFAVVCDHGGETLEPEVEREAIGDGLVVFHQQDLCLGVRHLPERYRQLL